jgi:hypothetical protein
VGDYVWAAWDYIGECGDGSPEYADYKTDAPEDQIRGGTCRIDVTGKMTQEVDYTKVALKLLYLQPTIQQTYTTHSMEPNLQPKVCATPLQSI